MRVYNHIITIPHTNRPYKFNFPLQIPDNIENILHIIQQA